MQRNLPDLRRSRYSSPVVEDEHSERKRRFLGRGALTSLVLHSWILFPLIVATFIFAAREEAEHANEVEMTFQEVDPATLPKDLPPLEPEPKPIKEPKPEAIAKNEKPEPIKPEEKPKEEPPPPKPEEVPPPPPPKPMAEERNKKSVDFKIEKEEAPDPNAQFLAEKSSRAKEETRATRTNLEKEVSGENEQSSPSDRQDKEAGDKENKIAQLEDVSSKRGRSAPEATPSLNPSLSENAGNARESLLKMRDTPKREHEVTPETAVNELPRDPEGTTPLPPDHLESMKDLEGRAGKSAQPHLRLTAKQYEYLFGNDKEAAAQLAQKKSSSKEGRFTKRLNRLASALENFIPEVKPGNQTALNTRAAPFAAFIARMHRSIHELWGFRYLDDLDRLPASNPLNNRGLLAKLEIVLNGEGVVDKVALIRPSGLSAFDMSAIDTVYEAGPFAEPPPAIRSGNGKIYIHWTFHRDERACATAFVEYFILDNANTPDTNRPLLGANMRPGENPTNRGGANRTGRSSIPGGAPGPSGSTSNSSPTASNDRPRALPEPDQEASRRAEARMPHPDDPAAPAPRRRLVRCHGCRRSRHPAQSCDSSLQDRLRGGSDPCRFDHHAARFDVRRAASPFKPPRRRADRGRPTRDGHRCPSGLR